MLNAKSLIETCKSDNSCMVEMEVNHQNQKQIMGLFREFKSLGYDPEILERNSSNYFHVKIESQMSLNNVIDLSDKIKQRSQIIKIDFVNKRRSL